VTDTATVVNHWTDLSEWTPGRSLFACYLTFETQPQLHRLVAAYQDELADLGPIDVIRPQWLHLTMQGIAFSDELDPGQADQLAAAVRERLVGTASCEFAVHRPMVGSDGVYLPAVPAGRLAELRGRVAAAAGDLLAPNPLYALPGQGNGTFSPHVSIAYANGDLPREAMLSRLARVDAPAVTVPVREVTMLNLRRDHRRWAWTDALTIPLAAG